MAKFSLGGDEDGEGPSSPRPKRVRISVQSSVVYGDYQEISEEEEEEEEEEGGGGEEEEISSPVEVEGSSAEEDEEEEEEEDEEEEEEEEGEAQQVQEADRACPVTVGSRANGGGQVCPEGSITVTLTDPEVLDCCICYEPLSTPIFQCENGHIACSSCCIKVRNKCPSCFWPIGYNRCRSMEKVLEAVKISCPNTQYGCKEAVSYSKKNDHEKTCLYAPCSCPLLHCNFVASAKQLYLHFSRKHPLRATCFLYDRLFSVSLNVNDKFLVLREQNDGVLFVLNNSVELLGNALAVSCIGPCSSTGGFSYTLVAKTDGNSLRLESSTKNSQHRVDNPSSTGFLLIPSEFFGSCGQLKLEVCIRQNAGCAAYARIRIGPL